MTGLDGQLMSQGVEGDTLPREPIHFVASNRRRCTTVAGIQKVLWVFFKD